MRKSEDPREVALDILLRSVCRIPVAAVLHDRNGIFSLGWNHAVVKNNQSTGMHAEEHAIRRANPSRLFGATLTVAGRYRKSGSWIYARPCEKSCLRLAKRCGIQRIQYTARGRRWEELDLRYVRV